jgi:hypothetical protein
VKDAGESGTDCGLGINVDNNNSVYITGFYLYRSLYDNILLPLPEAEDIFLAKLNQPFTGIRDLNEVLEAFPNPTSNILFVEKGAQHELSIVNTIGQTVLKPSKGTKAIDVSALENGHYYLRPLNKIYTKGYPFVIAR